MRIILLVCLAALPAHAQGLAGSETSIPLRGLGLDGLVLPRFDGLPDALVVPGIPIPGTPTVRPGLIPGIGQRICNKPECYEDATKDGCICEYKR